MTLQEAARTGLEPRTPLPTTGGRDGTDRRTDPRAAYFTYVRQQAADREKRRWEEALDAARGRGLDEAEIRARARAEARAAQRPRRWNNSRRDPHKHAAVLLEETSLPFREIASITGLDLYSIVGMKLKMRSGAVT
jgi:hypothetical protein